MDTPYYKLILKIILDNAAGILNLLGLGVEKNVFTDTTILNGMVIVNKRLSLNYIPYIAKMLWDWILNVFNDNKKHYFTEINVFITENLWGRTVSVRIQKII